MNSQQEKKRAQGSRRVEASEPADRRQCPALAGRVVQAVRAGCLVQAARAGWLAQAGLVVQVGQVGRPHQLDLPTVPRMENTRR
jgi:hypothetical protein